ncbi:MAG: hypothetical protein KBA26_14210, partial [Candidatus Delongbacteria bacterium]|nr:hypothetical protein [Candidatus Delongbacteria bacterium]
MSFHSSLRILLKINSCLWGIGWLMVGWMYLTPLPAESQSYHRDSLIINPKGCIWYAGLKDSTRILTDTSWSLGARDTSRNLYPPQPIIQSIMRSKPSRIPIPPGMSYISFHLTGNYYMTGNSKD